MHNLYPVNCLFILPLDYIIQSRFHPHGLFDSLRNCLGLSRARPLQRPTRIPTIIMVALDGSLGSGDGSLGEQPVSSAQQLLHLHGLSEAACTPQIEDVHTQPGEHIRSTGQNGRTPRRQSLQGEICNTTKSHVQRA